MDRRLNGPAERPVQRPSFGYLLWYTVGGTLPERYWSWVLHDTTCRTWALRAVGRVFAVLAPVLTLYILLMPGSLSLRLLTGFTFGGGIVLFMFVNILVDNDRRAVRAGYPSGLVSDIRDRRANEIHHLGVIARRDRAEQRRTRRNI